MRRLKTVRRPPIYPKTPGHLPCSSLTHPLPLPSRRPSVSFGGFGLTSSLALVVALAVLAWIVFWAFGGGSSSGAGIGPAGSNNGSSEGIQVHGHWTIDIREPDGSLVSRHEFDNALLSDADLFLAHLLSGDQVPAFWSIQVGNSDTAKGPCRTVFANIPCFVEEPDLVTTVPTSGTNANSFVLRGSLEAAEDGEVGFVSTLLEHCDTFTAPADCLSGTQSPGGTAFTSFTSTDLIGSDAIPVLKGQAINVTVVISFS